MATYINTNTTAFNASLALNMNNNSESKDIEELSGVHLGPGSLYGCLTKLEEAGLVQALPSEDRRRPYRLTGDGLRVLRDRLTESERIARVGLARIAGGSA